MLTWLFPQAVERDSLRIYFDMFLWKTRLFIVSFAYGLP